MFKWEKLANVESSLIVKGCDFQAEIDDPLTTVNSMAAEFLTNNWTRSNVESSCNVTPLENSLSTFHMQDRSLNEQQQQEIRTAVYNISEGIFNVMTTLVEKYIHYGDMSRMFKVYEEDEYQSEIIKELDRMKNEIRNLSTQEHSEECRKSAFKMIEYETITIRHQGRLGAYIEECRNQSAYNYLYDSILCGCMNLNALFNIAYDCRLKIGSEKGLPMKTCFEANLMAYENKLQYSQLLTTGLYLDYIKQLQDRTSASEQRYCENAYKANLFDILAFIKREFEACNTGNISFVEPKYVPEPPQAHQERKLEIVTPKPSDNQIIIKLPAH